MMKVLEDLRETLCIELEELSKKKEVNTQWLDSVNKLTDSIKNIDKIIMLGESEMYEDDVHSMRGNRYMGGNSYANRGKHYVRGHYSRGRDGWDMTGTYEARGGYSCDSGNIAAHLREMMDGADEREREAIKRCLRELGE